MIAEDGEGLGYLMNHGLHSVWEAKVLSRWGSVELTKTSAMRG